MRTLIISLLVLLPALNASADSSTDSKTTAKVPSSSDGFRMGLVKQKASSTYKVPDADGDKVVNEDIDLSGISIGYAYIPVNKVGCVINLSYMTMDNSSAYAITRFEANLASGFSNRVSGKIGINGSIQSFKDRLVGMSPQAGAGMNVGMEFQFNPVLGLGLNYMSMNQKVESSRVVATYHEQGLELGLHANF